MTKRSQMRLKGHGLRHEGRALLDERGVPFGSRDAAGLYVEPRGDGHGCALCECGATSPVLDSNAARKRWHRDHKTEMVKAGAA